MLQQRFRGLEAAMVQVEGIVGTVLDPAWTPAPGRLPLDGEPGQ